MSGYEDMLRMPHPVSARHPQMPIRNRAAQFAPFAALTGFDGAIAETARLTEEKPELDESARAELDECLRVLNEHLAERPEAALTCFVPDARKSGGAYVTVTGCVKKIDALTQTVLLADGTTVRMDDICSIKIELVREI